MGEKLNRHIFCKARMLERMVIHCIKNKFKKRGKSRKGKPKKKKKEEQKKCLKTWGEMSLFNCRMLNSLSGIDVL